MFLPRIDFAIFSDKSITSWRDREIDFENWSTVEKQTLRFMRKNKSSILKNT